MRSRLRPLGAGVLAGGVLGILFGGIGSRLVMRAIALADDREDFGALTGSGAVVGEVTASGTLAVVVGTGLPLGVLGGLLYIGLRRWLPRQAVARSLAFTALIVGFGLFIVVRGNEDDFLFVAPMLSVALFGVLLLLYGTLVPPAVDRLAPRRGAGGSALLRVVVAVACAAALVGLTTDAVVRALELSPS